MTRRFALYLLVVLATYLTMNYNAYEALVFVLFALLLLPAFSLIYILLQRRDLIIEQSYDPPELPHGADTRLLIHIRRSLPLPIYGLELATVSVPWPEDNPDRPRQSRRSLLDRLRGRAGHDLVRLQAAGRETAAFAIRTEALHRGVYELGVQGGRLEDPFGFFRVPIATRLEPAVCRLTVLPAKPATSAARQLVRTLVDERPRPDQRFSTDLDEVARLRAWRPGESMKLVHWAVSSHLRELQVREFAEPRQPAAALLCEGLHGDLTNPLAWRIADFAGDIACDLATLFATTRQPLTVYLPVTGRENSLRVETELEGETVPAAAFAEQNARLLAARPTLLSRAAEAASDSPAPAAARAPAEAAAQDAPPALDPHERECLRCLTEEIPADAAVCYVVLTSLQAEHVVALRQLAIQDRQVILLTLRAGSGRTPGAGGQEERQAELRRAGVVVLPLTPPWAAEAGA
ncbi:MAG: DUF58 domain-containing protein [Bacillota bacterium]|nr:DUF58 domain-containing protein [Bacillota bacterium]